MRAIEVHANRLSANARVSMRDCALRYRQARRRGSVTFMLRWLILASIFRKLAKDYLEAA